MATDGTNLSCMKPSEDEADLSYQPSPSVGSAHPDIHVVRGSGIFQGEGIYPLSPGSFRGNAMIGKYIFIYMIPVHLLILLETSYFHINLVIVRFDSRCNMLELLTKIWLHFA